MKLFLVCMIRNEIDILPSFLGHIDGLFDGGFVLDHLSADGSQSLLREFADARPGWRCERLENPGYEQAQISTGLMQRAFEAGADAVFFLDADEFIASHDRAALEKTVAALNTNRQIGTLRWRNCLPADYNKRFSLENPAWLCDLAPHKKLVAPTWLYREYGKALAVNQGNHSFALPLANRPPAMLFGELLHFPVRSRAQFVHKIALSYLSQAVRPDGVVAPHIRMLFEVLLARDCTPELMNAIALDYSGARVGELVAQAELARRGYRIEVPCAAMHKLEFAPPVRADDFTPDFGDLGAFAETPEAQRALALYRRA